MIAVVRTPVQTEVKGPTVTLKWASPLWGVEDGQRIEVVGFVRAEHRTLAIWRDDEGRLAEVPIEMLRMEPHA